MPIKKFDSLLNASVMNRLFGLVPGSYSRLGTAIRHGAAVLEERSGTTRRLLVVISDGLAYDLGYERDYGAADARRALAEARRRGTGCLCLTVGASTDVAELRRVFGSALATISRPEKLAEIVGPLFRSTLKSAEARRRQSQRKVRALVVMTQSLRFSRPLSALQEADHAIDTSARPRPTPATLATMKGIFTSDTDDTINGLKTAVNQTRPYYVGVGDEEQIFKSAYRQGLSILLKGPTGCGKTRFVEAMAHDIGRPLITVACHDDLTTADLVGRFLLRGGETEWVDGPLTRAVREGALCYLDEVVEARQDTTVVLHPLADHRRELPIERLGITLKAAQGSVSWCPTTPDTKVCSRISRTPRASGW